MIRTLLAGSALLLCFSCSSPETELVQIKKEATVMPPGEELQHLKVELESAIGKYKAAVGISMINLSTGDSLHLNDSMRYPMQSVFKFPLAVAVLKRIDANKLSLSQKVHVGRNEVAIPSGPFYEKYPKGNVDISVSELLAYTISQSDNNTCDILFTLIGGPARLNELVHEWGYDNIAINATEVQMMHNRDALYTNWSRPSTISRMLRDLQYKQLLSPASTELLLRLMTESVNRERLRGQLPETVKVAHKTGTSDTDAKGITAAVNDAGIITMPDGRQVALTVFVSNSSEDYATNQQIIAEVSKLVFGHYEFLNNQVQPQGKEEPVK